MNSQQYTYQNLMVAIDGSEKAKLAFQQALEFFQTNLFKSIHVLHVSNKKKDYLPKHLSNDHIEQEYKSELVSRYSSSRYNMCFQEQNQATARDQVLGLCSFFKGDVLFVGFTGRKGEKADPTILSTTVRSAAISSLLPLVVVKDVFTRKQQTSGGFTFLVCVDGSKKSLRCLHYAASIASQPNDKIIACFAPTPEKLNQKDEIEVLVNKELSTIDFKNWHFTSLKPNYDAAEEIIKYVNLSGHHDIQFVVLGNNGYRAETEKKVFFGRSAEQILCKIIANPIVLS